MLLYVLHVFEHDKISRDYKEISCHNDSFHRSLLSGDTRN